MLQDQYRAIMHFSIPKETQIERNALKSSQDWICIKVCKFRELAKYLFGGPNEGDWDGPENAVCMGENRNAYRVWWEHLKERDSLEDLGIDGRR